MDIQKVVLELRSIAIDLENGLIMEIGHLQPVKKGWVVKVNGQTDFEGEAGMLTAVKIANQTTRTISGYFDGENELWDVVEVFDDEVKATLQGRLNEQMAIYQIETGRIKWLE